MPLEESFITSFFTELVIPMRNRLLRMDNIGINLRTTRGGKASMRILLADWISEFFKFLRWTCSSAWQKQWLRWWHRAPEMRSSALSSNPSLTSNWPQAQQNAGEMSAGTMAQCLSDKLLRSYWWCTCGGSEWDRQHWELMIQVANVEDAIWAFCCVFSWQGSSLKFCHGLGLHRSCPKRIKLCIINIISIIYYDDQKKQQERKVTKVISGLVCFSILIDF